MPLTRREAVLLKLETTYGTDAVPTGSTDALEIAEPATNVGESARMIDRPLVRPFLGMKKSLFGGTLQSVSFKCELKGSGTAGTPPAIGKALQCCGLSETIVALTSVAYKPVSGGASQKSGDIYYYQDGVLHKMSGARGNASFDISVGQVPMVTFTFTGHTISFTDASLPAVTFEATIPNPVLGATFTIGGYAAVINAMSFDLGNKVSAVGSVTALDGFGEVRITDRNVTGSLDPELVLVATHDVITRWKSRTEQALVYTLPGTAGNILSVTAPKVVYGPPTQGDREGIRTWSTPFMMVDNAGDDEVVLTFT